MFYHKKEFVSLKVFMVEVRRYNMTSIPIACLRSENINKIVVSFARQGLNIYKTKYPHNHHISCIVTDKYIQELGI